MASKIVLFFIGVLFLCGNSYALELSQDEIFWLTQNIYWESRNQPESGQIKVAIVTLNRMMSDAWPGTVKSVVTQPDQFSWYWDGKSDIPKETEAWKHCRNVAIIISNVWQFLSPEHKRIFWFHRFDVNWKYKNDYQVYAQYGDHIFYIPKTSNDIHPKT